MGTFNLEEVNPQFGRVKGADWFPLLYNKEVMVLGVGGIGSWTALLLSRIGCELHIYDMDQYEIHNLSGQAIGHSSLGLNKAMAIQERINDFSPDCSTFAYPEQYSEDSPASEIMVCGFDNMVARKTAFNNWKTCLMQESEEYRKDSFFQDGRLLAEQLQIFNIPGDRADLIEQYEKDWLFDDKEVKEAECTFKQTSHCAAMIASHMVGFLTNWASNVRQIKEGKRPFKQVPFMYEYFIPLNKVL